MANIVANSVGTTSGAYDVVVVGGGISGLTTAWRLLG